VGADPLRLTEQTGLIGHGGWADGRNGDYAGSSLQVKTGATVYGRPAVQPPMYVR
jgi:hypothetical protein